MRITAVPSVEVTWRLTVPDIIRVGKAARVKEKRVAYAALGFP